ncbi:MAG: hypothetical protein ACI971_002821 [Colwellia sp.]|jgi:hypothetical protein
MPVFETCAPKTAHYITFEEFGNACLSGKDTLDSPIISLPAGSFRWYLEHGCVLTILIGSSTLNQEIFRQASAKVNMLY